MTIELERRAFVQAGVALTAGAAVAGARAGDYVEAFMKAIRWANADNLYAQHARGW